MHCAQRETDLKMDFRKSVQCDEPGKIIWQDGPKESSPERRPRENSPSRRTKGKQSSGTDPRKAIRKDRSMDHSGMDLGKWFSEANPGKNSPERCNQVNQSGEVDPGKAVQ